MREHSITRLLDQKKRGGELSPKEWEWIADAFTAGAIPRYQMSALLMAVWFRGMSSTETLAFTEALRHSGSCLDLSDLPRPTVDKHSTGGVGDKVSLALAPLAAACGLAVPMVSGRGLGHTGGTLDKLASIPGFRVLLSPDEFVRQVETIGCAMMGQSKGMAPADGKIYALRDVTATIDCIPLIAASIMSKKLAAGPSGLVFDVKVGSGAFMQELAEAEELAKLLITIGEGAGRRVTALMTDMDQPLGYAVGNALEVKEILSLLQGDGPEDLVELTVALAVEMLLLAGTTNDPEKAFKRAHRRLEDGSALAKFVEMVEAQGGDPRIVDDSSILAAAPVKLSLQSPGDGYLARLDARLCGEVAVALGAGRRTIESEIDPSVGFVLKAKVGDQLSRGQEIMEIHASDRDSAESAAKELHTGIVLSQDVVALPPLIIERMDASGKSPWWFAKEKGSGGTKDRG